jgi:hypothetical protein
MEMWKNSGYFYIKPAEGNKTYFFVCDISDRNPWVEAVKEVTEGLERATAATTKKSSTARQSVVPPVMHRQSLAPKSSNVEAELSQQQQQQQHRPSTTTTSKRRESLVKSQSITDLATRPSTPPLTRSPSHSSLASTGGNNHGYASSSSSANGSLVPSASSPSLSRQAQATLNKMQTIKLWTPREMHSFLFSQGFGRYTAAFGNLTGEQAFNLSIPDLVLLGITYVDAKKIYEVLHLGSLETPSVPGDTQEAASTSTSLVQ